MSVIVVDGVELNLSIPKSDEVRWDKLTYNEKWFCDGIQSVIGLKNIVLKNKKPINKKYFLKQATGFDLVAKRKNPETGIDEKWVFCDKVELNSKTGVKRYPAKRLSIRHEAVYTDPSLMFFLTTKELRLDKVGFVVENKEQDAKIKNSIRKVEAEVSNWIFNKCTKEDIIKLSYRWGVSIKDKSEDELRDSLYERVAYFESNKNSEKGYKLFIEEVNSDSDVAKVATYFFKAIEDEVIAFNPSKRIAYWTGTDEAIGPVIPPARYAKDKEEYIIQYLSNNLSEKQLFFDSLSGDADEIAAKTGDYMMISNVMKLKAWVRANLDTELKSTKLAEMKNEIAEIISSRNS
ncbi:hypothetical protein JW865_09375 [Candidatus Bathyarchaeota archaeon]|nr:hypothetical protein [Candidatus Bathyarchaeota archaeon]